MDVSFLEEAFPNQLKLYMARYQQEIERHNRELELEWERYKRDIQNSQQFFLNLVSQKFETQPSENLINKIQSVKSTEVFLRALDLLHQFDSIEEFEKDLDKLVP